MVIRLKSGAHVTRFIPAHGLKTVTSIEVNGHRYQIAPDAAFELINWVPERPHHLWWSDFRDMVPFKRIGLLFYDEPEDKLQNVVLGRAPLDRRAVVQDKAITPSFMKTMAESKVYRDYERQRLGQRANSRTLVILLAAGLIVAVLLFMGGYI